MTIEELIARAQRRLDEAIAARRARQDALVALRGRVESGDTAVTLESVQAAIAERDTADTEVDARRTEVEELRAEAARDAEITAMQEVSIPTGDSRRAYDEVARVGQEARTYTAERDRRGQGRDFLTDVVAAFRGATDARERLERHQTEERVERGGVIPGEQRATSTANFTGWVLPQYLVDLNAAAAMAGRQFADLCNGHDLPETGMTAYLSKITTGSSVDDQSSEGATVSEQDMDDTQISIGIRTAAGSQTISRQAIERGLGVDEITVADLMGRYNVNLDSKLLNAATSGLTNVATSVTYTSGSPTAAEFYPKLQGAAAGVEGVFLNQVDSIVAVMHPRRWRWLSAAMTSTWPFVSGPTVPAQSGAVTTGLLSEQQARAIRGYLPDGTPVVTDANIATNLGAGTNQDEAYVVVPRECHLWEDPSAPWLIRAETAPKTLRLDLVLYGYYAFYHDRYTGGHRKISGTGLVAPTF